MFVSIIIRTYNSERYIRRAIQSALFQIFPRNGFEIIVVDDGSIDTTYRILKEYKGSIRIIRLRHKGAIPAANIGIRVAQGKYISFLDSDDEYTPEFLHEMTRAIRRSGADFAYCDYREIFSRGTQQLVSCKNNIFNTLLNTLLFKKKSIVDAGFLNELLIFPEYDLLLKMQDHWKAVSVPKPLFVYHRHKKSVTALSSTVEQGMEQLHMLYPGKLEKLKKVKSYS